MTMKLTRLERKDRLRHGALSKIARELGYAPSRVSQVLHTERTGQRSPDDRIERAIADAIGLPLDDVFPPRVQPEALGVASDPAPDIGGSEA